MLEKVRLTWIKGLLEPLLTINPSVELGLASRPDVVERPFNILVQRPAEIAQPIRSHTAIGDIFVEAGRAMLILGAPGAGKTTLLLQLASKLLGQAEQNEDYLIPVVFNLSSWAERQLMLADWLVDELVKRYDVPRRLAKDWIGSELILPLLDGLDEVVPEQREYCVVAINTFIKRHGLLPIVICSRLADYESLTARLRLPSAILIQPLTCQQVKDHLQRAGDLLRGLRIALIEDPALWDLLDTPLMLSIATQAYQECPASEIRIGGTVEDRRTQLFARYTHAMFERRTQVFAYTREQSLKWLSWLAAVMKRNNQTIFYLEWLQPDYLPRSGQRRIVTLGAGVLGGLAFWLCWELTTSDWSLRSLWRSLFFSTIGLGIGASTRRIKPAEAVQLRWPVLREGLVKTLAVGTLLMVLNLIMWITSLGLTYLGWRTSRIPSFLKTCGKSIAYAVMKFRSTN